MKQIQSSEMLLLNNNHINISRQLDNDAKSISIKSYDYTTKINAHKKQQLAQRKRLTEEYTSIFKGNGSGLSANRKIDNEGFNINTNHHEIPGGAM